MGNPYTPVTVANYNTSPPSDDGQQTAANEVEWAKHKDKLGDPLKTAVEATQTNITAAFAKRIGNSTTTHGSNHTIIAGDEGKILESTAAITFTLLSSATASEGFLIGLANTSSGNTTVTPDGSETINGLATFTLSPQQFLWLSSDGSNWTILFQGFLDDTPLPRGYIDGLILSNDTDTDHDIEIAIGACRDTDDSKNIKRTAVLVKQIDANWVEGSAAGGFPSGLTLAELTYHVFVILKSDGTVDGGFDTSLTATNLLADATGYTEYRRVGSVITDSSFNILAFFQFGNEFFHQTRANDFSDNAPGTAAVTRALRVPTGIEVLARLAFLHRDSSASTTSLALVSSLDAVDQTPSTAAFTTEIEANGGVGASDSSETIVKTDTSAQIRTRNSISNAGINVEGATVGWIDRRGQNA